MTLIQAISGTQFWEGAVKLSSFDAHHHLVVNGDAGLTSLTSSFETVLIGTSTTLLCPERKFKIGGVSWLGLGCYHGPATGYQDVRNRLALQEMFEAVLRKELAAWAKRFLDEFYKQIYRLRGWEWRGRQINPPQVVAHYTNDFIYDRIAPGLRKELENRMPKTESGKKKGRLHQLLTDDIRHPLLAQYVHMVTMFMKAAGSWDEFKVNLNKVSPKQGDNYELSLEGS